VEEKLGTVHPQKLIWAKQRISKEVGYGGENGRTGADARGPFAAGEQLRGQREPAVNMGRPSLPKPYTSFVILVLGGDWALNDIWDLVLASSRCNFQL